MFPCGSEIIGKHLFAVWPLSGKMTVLGGHQISQNEAGQVGTALGLSHGGIEEKDD